MERMMAACESSKAGKWRATIQDPSASERECTVIDDMLFLVIVVGIALAILYVHGALRTRRARRMSADHSS
jgi:hypothetical protein